jgi:biotin carboxyl carrier protein
MTLHREFVRGDETVAVRVEHQGTDHYRIQVGNRTLHVRATVLEGGGVHIVPLSAEGTSPTARATDAFAAAGPESTVQVRVDGRTWTLQQPGRRRTGAGTGADGTVRAPMTGTVAKVLCREGDAVAADQTLVVLTAMKMEHKLTAGIAGVVESLGAGEGATVEQGALLAVVVPDHSPAAAAPV